VREFLSSSSATEYFTMPAGGAILGLPGFYILWADGLTGEPGALHNICSMTLHALLIRYLQPCLTPRASNRQKLQYSTLPTGEYKERRT
jgi:hypothetical protein